MDMPERWGQWRHYLSQRLKNLDRFTSSSSGFLSATDVAARGLNIPDIEQVVHYQALEWEDSQGHRSGSVTPTSGGARGAEYAQKALPDPG